MERLTEKHYGTDGYYMKCSEDCANDDEMCGGCPYLDKIIDRLGAYEATGLTPEQVTAIAKDNNVPGKWIPVTERLPELERNVLVVDRVTGEVTTAYLNICDCFVFEDGRGHGANYWMPLPEPPKEVQK